MGSAIWPDVSSGAGNTVLARAQALLGTTITKVMGTDFDNDQWYRVAGTAGTVTPSVTKKGGVVTLSTTTTANRSAILLPHGTIDLVDNMRTSRWYTVARFAATTAVDAQANIDVRMFAATIGSPQVIFGCIGALSTAFFSYQVVDNAGATTVSGATSVAIDTNMHVWEMWCNGTTLSLAIDGVTVTTTAATNVGTNPTAPALVTINGTTAAARTMDADYLYVCTGDPS